MIVESSARVALSAPLRSGHVDEPKAGSLDGDLIISGWVVGEDKPVREVVVRTGGMTLGRVPVHRERKDIAEALPGYEHALHSGFRFRVTEPVMRQVADLDVAAVVDASPAIPFWRIRLAAPTTPQVPRPRAGLIGRLVSRHGAGIEAEQQPQVPASPAPPPYVTADFRVVAILSAFNEADVIGSVLDHLESNGVFAYVIDNGSTDVTINEVRKRLGRCVIGIEELPPSGSGRVSWAAILARKVELASELGADWYIHHDADEVRETPWPGVRLRDALRMAERMGYSAVDFRVLNFPPVDDRFRPGDDPRDHFLRWEDPAEYDRLQRKCWRAGATDVALEDGGHDVRFTGRKLFPLRFVLRHYPIRGQAHGTRKVLQERHGRFTEDEIAIGWHRQYADIEGPDHRFLRNPAELKPFDLDRVRLETVLEDGANAPRDADSNAAERTRALHASGVMEKATERVISGWAIRDDRPDEPVEVELWDGGRTMGRIKADRPRPDLAEAGLGDGSHGGFALRTPSQLLDGRSHWIWATVAGTPIALNRSPQMLHFSGRPLQAPAAPRTPAREPA